MKKVAIIFNLLLTFNIFSNEIKDFIKVWDIPDMSFIDSGVIGLKGIRDFKIKSDGTFILYNINNDKIFFVNKDYDISNKIEDFKALLPQNILQPSSYYKLEFKNEIIFTITEYRYVFISKLSDIGNKSYSFKYKDYLSNWSDFGYNNVIYYDNLILGEKDYRSSKTYYSFEIPKNYKGKAIYRDTEATLEYIKDNYSTKESLWVDDNNFIHLGDKPYVANTKTFFDYFNTKNPEVIPSLVDAAIGTKYMGTDIDTNYYFSSVAGNYILVFDNEGRYLTHFYSNLKSEKDYLSAFNIDNEGNIYTIVMKNSDKTLAIYKLDRDW